MNLLPAPALHDRSDYDVGRVRKLNWSLRR